MTAVEHDGDAAARLIRVGSCDITGLRKTVGP
jgi:hypothetical protein